MSRVERLIGLQELEIEMAGLEKALAEARAKVGESPALKKAKLDVAQASENYQQLCEQQKGLEWQSEDAHTKLKAVNEKLYSGRVSSPKELTNLQQEAELLNSKASALDEEGLEVIEKAENAAKSLAGLKGTLEQTEAVWQVEQKNLKEEIANMQLKLEQLREKRELSIKDISGHALQLYERVKQQKGVAVARVVHGTCEGCRISLSTAQLQRARGESLERCGNCGRILFCE